VKKLFETVTSRIRGFVAQRDALALAIRSPSHESAYILKIIQGEDETDTANLYWSYAEPFTHAGARAYVDAIVAHFNEKLEAVIRLQEKEAKEKETKEQGVGNDPGGGKPWPGLPPEVKDAKSAPADRLRALMIFSRTLLPKLEGHAVVWTFFPMEVTAPVEYAALFESLLKHEMPYPWCHHLRVIIRDEPHQYALKGLPKTVGRTLEYQPDLSVAAMEKSLEEETADPDLPLAERCQNTLILANMDFSHRRYAQALEKYNVILKYYLGTGNPVMTALTLNGMGEAYDRMEKPKEAKAHFEAALNPAIKAQSNPVLLNISLNLGNLMVKHKVWSEAEIYYDSAATFAKALLIPQTRIESLNNQGLCQYRLGRPKEALDTWDSAAMLAKGMEEKDLHKKVLANKQMLFRETGHPEREKAVAREMQAIG